MVLHLVADLVDWCNHFIVVVDIGVSFSIDYPILDSMVFFNTSCFLILEIVEVFSNIDCFHLVKQLYEDIMMTILLNHIKLFLDTDFLVLGFEAFFDSCYRHPLLAISFDIQVFFGIIG